MCSCQQKEQFRLLFVNQDSIVVGEVKNQSIECYSYTETLEEDLIHIKLNNADKLISISKKMIGGKVVAYEEENLLWEVKIIDYHQDLRELFPHIIIKENNIIDLAEETLSIHCIKSKEQYEKKYNSLQNYLDLSIKEKNKIISTLKQIINPCN